MATTSAPEIATLHMNGDGSREMEAGRWVVIRIPSELTQESVSYLRAVVRDSPGPHWLFIETPENRWSVGDGTSIAPGPHWQQEIGARLPGAVVEWAGQELDHA